MTESRGFDLKDPQGQSDFFHRVAKMLLEFEDEIERTTYLEAVAREYQVKPDMLQRLVGRLALKGAGVPGRSRRNRDSTENRREKMVMSSPEAASDLDGHISRNLRRSYAMDFTGGFYNAPVSLGGKRCCTNSIRMEK